MLVRLAREAHLGGRWRHAKPGELVVEVSKFNIDPDAIGWLVNHGRAPYAEDGSGPTREIWDLIPLSGARGSYEGGAQRWENAEFVALPDSVAELARVAFPRGGSQ